MGKHEGKFPTGKRGEYASIGFGSILDVRLGPQPSLPMQDVSLWTISAAKVGSSFVGRRTAVNAPSMCRLGRSVVTAYQLERVAR